MTDLDIDICCFSETWLRKGDTSKVAEIKELGYSMWHISRPGRGGGVAIAFKKNIAIVTQVKSKRYKSFEHIECLAKSSHSKPVRIVCLYRPGTGLHNKVSEFCEEFQDYLDHLNELYGKLLIIGDFNIHMEDEKCPDTIKFLSILKQHKLQQHIHEATHICQGTLDLVLTRDILNERLEISNSQVLQTTTTSDHFLVKFNCQFPHSKTTAKKIISTRKLNDINIDQFKSELLISDLNDSSKFLNCGNAVKIYNRELQRLLNKHAPVVSFTIKEDQPRWMNATCQEAKRKRRKFESLLRKNKTQESKLQYSNACKQAALIIKDARDNYYRDKLSSCEDDKKKTYSLVNHLLDKNVSFQCLPKGKETSVIAEEMKDFFHSKVNKIYSEFENNDIPTNFYTSDDFKGQPLFDFKPLTEEQLTSVISASNKKECELDPIPVSILMKCLPELTNILLFIVNDSLSSGIFPHNLKEALVRPDIKDKNGDLDDYKNYRPISNLPFISKLLEKCVYKELSFHLSLNNLHAENQSAYRVHHSCETATLALYNDLLCMSDTKSKVILLLLDLSAAFDTVCHEILLTKLHNKFGLKGTVLQWLKSYLNDRSFTVNIEKSKSGKCMLTIGVPQGSILGPILFILYTKELETIAKKHGFMIHLYADDTQIYIKFSPLFENFHDIEVKIVLCFQEISEWMVHNKLKLNSDKTEALIIKSRNNFDLEETCIASVQLNVSEKIDCSETVKSLEVYFDNYLTFDYHITKYHPVLQYYST